ncbi:hypothetical protein FRC04_003505 [Tulasnella sp. 424]|nr:hypothetical protein FRC04_003505 [Tulasnella sp. 424]
MPAKRAVRSTKAVEDEQPVAPQVDTKKRALSIGSDEDTTETLEKKPRNGPVQQNRKGGKKPTLVDDEAEATDDANSGEETTLNPYAPLTKEEVDHIRDTILVSQKEADEFDARRRKQLATIPKNRTPSNGSSAHSSMPDLEPFIPTQVHKERKKQTVSAYRVQGKTVRSQSHSVAPSNDGSVPSGIALTNVEVIVKPFIPASGADKRSGKQREGKERHLVKLLETIINLSVQKPGGAICGPSMFRYSDARYAWKGVPGHANQDILHTSGPQPIAQRFLIVGEVEKSWFLKGDQPSEQVLIDIRPTSAIDKCSVGNILVKFSDKSLPAIPFEDYYNGRKAKEFSPQACNELSVSRDLYPDDLVVVECCLRQYKDTKSNDHSPQRTPGRGGSANGVWVAHFEICYIFLLKEGPRIPRTTDFGLSSWGLSA